MLFELKISSQFMNISEMRRANGEPIDRPSGNWYTLPMYLQILDKTQVFRSVTNSWTAGR